MKLLVWMHPTAQHIVVFQYNFLLDPQLHIEIRWMRRVTAPILHLCRPLGITRLVATVMIWLGRLSTEPVVMGSNPHVCVDSFNHRLGLSDRHKLRRFLASTLLCRRGDHGLESTSMRGLI